MRELAMDPMQVRLEALKLAEHLTTETNKLMEVRDMKNEIAVIRRAATFEKYISEGQVP